MLTEPAVRQYRWTINTEEQVFREFNGISWTVHFDSIHFDSARGGLHRDLIIVCPNSQIKSELPTRVLLLAVERQN